MRADGPEQRPGVRVCRRGEQIAHRRLFDHLEGTPALLGNPTVVNGVGVTHLRYPVLA